MKIALLGPSRSGKTAYFSALYYKHRNLMAASELKAELEAEYRGRGIDRVTLRIDVSDVAIDAILAANAALLAQRPIQWPNTTRMLDRSKIAAKFDFFSLPPHSAEGVVTASNYSNFRSYERSIEILDPTGGAFDGDSEFAVPVLRDIATCDMAIVLIPADILRSLWDRIQLY